MTRRSGNHPWKRTEADRGFMGRVNRARERGEYTPPGTRPNVMDPAKVARKRTGPENPS
jgi:hypothetical protein